MIAASPYSPLVALQGPQRRPDHHGHVVARELVLGKELPDLHLDELQKLRVVDHVRLVQEHHDVGNPHLAGQQDMLAVWGIGPSAATPPGSPRPSGRRP
jgi:hypothetical protein